MFNIWSLTITSFHRVLRANRNIYSSICIRDILFESIFLIRFYNLTKILYFLFSHDLWLTELLLFN